MNRSLLARLRGAGKRLLAQLLPRLPQAVTSRLYRRSIDLTPPAVPSLELKLAETQEELEACFALLHDAYVASGFMRPHPAGLRVTAYHALPTTSTLCAKVDGLVVGTLSIVRDGVFGFPMQSAFDISAVRAKGGCIAEISALAIHPRFRRTGGTILFPLMKFMYEYCTRYFDTRHLLIAVNPTHIGMYESLLFFRRLTAQPVDRYDFANGAPAVGATLDLAEAPTLFKRAYAGRAGKRDLYRYFVNTTLPAIRFPGRDWHVSNDPVLTPGLLNYFFAQRTQTFTSFDSRRIALLHSIYHGDEWAPWLPPIPEPERDLVIRRQPRFSLQCPATVDIGNPPKTVQMTIVEISGSGFRARTDKPLQVGARAAVSAELGAGRWSHVVAEVVRHAGGDIMPSYGFKILQADAVWERCVRWLEDRPAPGMAVAASIAELPPATNAMA